MNEQEADTTVDIKDTAVDIKNTTVETNAETGDTNDATVGSNDGHAVADEPAGEQASKPDSPEDFRALLTITDLDFYYGETQALFEVNLRVPEHQVTSFIGPSGCGKSTLLRCINRMNDVIPGTRHDGDLLLGDVDIYGDEVDAVALRRHVGMVFQKPNPFPKSIYENVAYGIRLHEKLSKSELDEKVQWALEKSHLWDEVKDRLQESGTSLSGGQQQRLCIARALAVQPKVMLMDEPCSALDPVATQKIEDLILELKEEVTIVIVTHSMSQAARVSDRTAFFYKGKLVESGPTATLFENPKEELTEQYITGRFG